MASKLITCDRLRRTSNGEDFWQSMMKNRRKVSERKFLSNVKIKDVLDDGETWDEYKDNAAMQGGPIKFYESGGTYFFQTAGFEFIWLRSVDKKKVARELLSIAKELLRA